MTIQDFTPAKILQPFVKTYRIIESQEGLTNRVVPNTSLAIALRIKGQNSYSTASGVSDLPDITLSGLRKSVRLINYSKNASTLIVLFKECGASYFFKEPLHELFEDSIPLDSIISPAEVTLIEELLEAAQNNSQRVAVIDQFLLEKLTCFNPDKLVSEALAKIHVAKGFIKIRELADSLCISNDAFEKRFRKIVGSSPKQFAAIVRLSSIIRQEAKGRLLDIAFDAGYYDQAHFTKDFKLFTGQTPTDFYKAPRFW
ncbi:MAG TPA: helix-turn-helix domain-containing protein [Chryseosolibacter sp.]|nr:helix-turn-helix domain-containing protein [Chryseosolibacter sp.]